MELCYVRTVSRLQLGIKKKIKQTCPKHAASYSSNSCVTQEVERR